MFRYILLFWRILIVLSKNALRGIAGIVMMFFFSSTSAMSKAPEGYHAISENKVESEKYELRKTNINFMYKIILFDPINNNMIVSSSAVGFSSCVKINEKGYIIDRYSHDSTLLMSGVFFDEFTFVDWAISGNKIPQKYSKIINADTLTEKEFKRYISSADEVAYEIFYSKNEHVRVYLKVDNNWMVLETVKRFDNFSSNINERHYDVNSTVYPKNKKNRLVPLTPETYRISWEHPDNKISIAYFNKEGSSSSRFMDINNMTWDGDYGTGYFNIKHQGDVLYFKAHTTKSASRFSPDIEIYVIPEKYRSKADIALIELSRHSKNKRSVEEAGLYVLREKIKISGHPVKNIRTPSLKEE